jgi:hypothetical protein
MPDRPKDFAGLSGKWPAKLSDFLKIVRQNHRTFLKKFHKVIGLFKKSLAMLSIFPEKVRQSPRTIRKMSDGVIELL